MTEERQAVVFDDELAAIRESRSKGMLLFHAAKDGYGPWVVATSEHQAKLAMVDYIWPLKKISKRERDNRQLEIMSKLFDEMQEQPVSEPEPLIMVVTED
jgi:hypothetical protein